jgi:serine/threonine-protein kinase
VSGSNPDRSPRAGRLRLDPRIEALIQQALPSLPGRLSLGDELARGGMGSVRDAFDSGLQRRMAAKTMHPGSYDHFVLVHGFLREAQVTGQLDHPNIVPIYELGRDEQGELYFTMKLVQGRSLRAMIGRAPPADSEALFNLLEVFVKVCDALAFAHSRGVLHCDIKAANVMVGEYGQVFLMDWGGARVLERTPGRDTTNWLRDSLPPLPEAETEGLVLGTPAYMSPEQAAGASAQLDERADVFSMGALLYEIMTGRPPYPSANPYEGLAFARACKLVRPDRLPGMPVHLYPQELVRIVMKALQRRPEDRYRSVDALRRDLQRMLRGASDFETLHVRAGDHVIREGEVGDAAYIVASGELEVYKTVDGAAVPLRRLGPGDMFGETAILASSPRTASVVARADAALVVVTSGVIEQEVASMKPWMGAFIRTLASRFGAMETAPPPRPARPPAPADEPEAYTVIADVLAEPREDG